MIKCYLTVPTGVIAEKVFVLEDGGTIGRGASSTIQLTDASVSKRHAVIHLKKDLAIVEDLGSRNGTFVNGERIKKATLRHGDVLKIGKVALSYSEEEVLLESTGLLETQEVASTGGFDQAGRMGLGQRSPKLLETLSKVSLFNGLDRDSLARVSQAARLLICARGKTIVRQGDRGKSLHIILDGKVRVFTYDHRGGEVPLAVMSAGQFFGEASLLTGEPRNATVQAVEEALLCELDFESMRGVVQRFPEVKGVLEQYHRKRLADSESRKRAAGVSERRRHPRFNVEIPVRFAVSPSARVSGQFTGRVFDGTSADISISGVRIHVQDPSLIGMPVGHLIRLEIRLPGPSGIARCLGLLRNVIEARGGQGQGRTLGIEFLRPSEGFQRKLKGFLSGDPPIGGAGSP